MTLFEVQITIHQILVPQYKPLSQQLTQIDASQYAKTQNTFTYEHARHK